MQMRLAENEGGIGISTSIEQLMGSLARLTLEYPRCGGKAMPSIFHGISDSLESLGPVAEKLVHQHDHTVASAGQTLHELEIAGMTTGTDLFHEKRADDRHRDSSTGTRTFSNQMRSILSGLKRSTTVRAPAAS